MLSSIFYIGFISNKWLFLKVSDSSERLYKQDYLKGFEGFINSILSNPKNISESVIRCPSSVINSILSNPKNILKGLRVCEW